MEIYKVTHSRPTGGQGNGLVDESTWEEKRIAPKSGVKRRVDIFLLSKKYLKIKSYMKKRRDEGLRGGHGDGLVDEST